MQNTWACMHYMAVLHVRLLGHHFLPQLLRSVDRLTGTKPPRSAQRICEQATGVSYLGALVMWGWIMTGCQEMHEAGGWYEVVECSLGSILISGVRGPSNRGEWRQHPEVNLWYPLIKAVLGAPKDVIICSLKLPAGACKCSFFSIRLGNGGCLARGSPRNW